mgnify:CR=1 FL=1
MKDKIGLILLIVITILLGILAIEAILPHISYKVSMAKLSKASQEKTKEEGEIKARKLEIGLLDGSSVTTYLSSDIAVNKNSSLRRQWVVVNDTSCPIELIGAGYIL